MRVAGVWVAPGQLAWADAGEHRLALLDAVVMRIGDVEVEGVVHVLPEQWIEPPGAVVGVIAAVVPPVVQVDDVFPGSDMPALGEWVRADEVEGRVTAIDVLEGRVTIAGEDGEAVVVGVDEVR